MNCLMYRVYNTGKNGKFYNEERLAEELKKILKPDGVDLIRRRDEKQYVLVRYEFEDPLSMGEIDSHFTKTTQKIGELSDEINCELGIQLMITFTGTVVTPDSMVKKGKAKCATCDKCPDGCADCDEGSGEEKESEEDEWAEVKRLRDLGSKH